MHYRGFGSKSQSTPQNEPIPGSNQVLNNAQGYSWAVDDITRLHRFLVLGSSSNTYYTTARKLTKENLDAVERLLQAGQGKAVVNSIVEISQAGRAPSNDPALFALARCAAADDQEVRQYALSVLPQVARTGTHLLHFVAYTKQFRGWGRAYRRAVAEWFNARKEQNLAYQLVKYQQRDGYSQRDLLRLAHPKAATETYNTLYHWVTKGWEWIGDEPHPDEALRIIWAYEKAKRATDDQEVAALIKQYKLPREAVPTQFLHSVHVWEALLEDMPMEAMTRNLATMTREGVIKPLGDKTREIAERLRNQDAILKSKLHPIKILAALMTYQSGKSVRGDATWTPVQTITDALNDAFYLSFGAVEPSHKRIVLALDVSGSMSMGTVGNTPGLTPRVASAAMALVTAATEPHHTIMAFSHELVPLSISPKRRLDDVIRATDGLPFGRTDCAQPMLWAMKNDIAADAFVVLTDSETWAGSIHPSQALQEYRKKTSIDAKLVVVGMVSNGFTIADPNDKGMLDCVGFDTATPEIISGFTRGEF
jgi:60 kDa SS-A/Ro ribonucleoprotein